MNSDPTDSDSMLSENDSFDSFLEAVARLPEHDPAVRSLKPGLQITNSIRLVRKLGEGGMGSVWVASHEALGCEVAVKFVSISARMRNPNAIRRFKREARAAAKLSSPHSVRVFDHGAMDDGTPYLVMELLQGESLLARLSKDTLSLDEADRLLIQVCEVLHRAHGMGLVHRDIKPANLFLVEMGYGLFVKVLDFGLAKELDQTNDSLMTQSGAVMGTVAYMSPEQIRSSRDVGHSADLWSLAVTMYEVLAGTLPFGGETSGAMMVNISTAAFEPLASLRDDVPEAIEQWFQKALHKDESQRFGSAQAMSEAFSNAISKTNATRAEPPIRSDKAKAVRDRLGRAVTVATKEIAQGDSLDGAAALSEQNESAAPSGDAKKGAAPIGPSPRWRRTWTVAAAIALGAALTVAATRMGPRSNPTAGPAQSTSSKPRPLRAVASQTEGTESASVSAEASSATTPSPPPATSQATTSAGVDSGSGAKALPSKPRSVAGPKPLRRTQPAAARPKTAAAPKSTGKTPAAKPPATQSNAAEQASAPTPAGSVQRQPPSSTATGMLLPGY